MSRDKDLRAVLADIDNWTDPASTRAEGDVSLVDSFPASSRLMRELRSELRKVQDDPSSSPELREQLSAVLRGKSDLSSLFTSGEFALPSAEQLPSGSQEILKSIEEGELE